MSCYSRSSSGSDPSYHLSPTSHMKKQLIRLAIATAIIGGCSGESIGGLGAVSLDLTAVDGRALPAAVGNTQSGIAMVATAGELVGSATGANCTYFLKFQPSAGGNAVEVNGSISPEPCSTEAGAVQTVNIGLNRADLPTGTHTYRFQQ